MLTATHRLNPIDIQLHLATKEEENKHARNAHGWVHFFGFVVIFIGLIDVFITATGLVCLPKSRTSV